ncbi:MAG: hypothetical protein JXB26_03720 [Candidatus Aminicenantes bacterium]|nr:hypothetical protein [Candidatus Aminicenantes bacterium]
MGKWQVTMEKTGISRELETVTNLFISSEGEDKAPLENLYAAKEKTSIPKEADCDVEEILHIRKNIAYPETENAQESMKRRLFQLFQEGYMLNRVELKKNTCVHHHQKRRVSQEEIAIFLKTSAPE